MSLFEATRDLIVKDQISNVLEIGSGHGNGSTQLLIQGLLQVTNPSKRLYCLEAKDEQFNNLLSNTQNYNFISCFKMSSISSKSVLLNNFENDVWLPSYNKIRETNNFPKELVRSWYEEEVEYVKKVEQGFLDTLYPQKYFDMVIIDGSEFLGYSEFVLIKDRCKYLVLDDVHKCFKNFRTYEEISNSILWNIVYDNPNDRNGTVIAIKK
jgi:hypothetical protein